jgi:transposase
VFGTLYSQVALKTLAAFPTADAVLSASDAAIATMIHEACRSRSAAWAQQLREAARRNPMRTADVPHQVFGLRLYTRMIAEYQAHLTVVDAEIEAVVRDIEACRLIQSIPGIGVTLAATIIAELGEITRFDHPKRLVAFAGVDPSVRESGDFKATVNRITKRGSSRLRHALFVAALRGLGKSGSKRVQAIYQAKRAVGTPHKVALVACIYKLLHWIYAVLTRRVAFVDIV